MYEIHFYKDRNGKEPVKEYIAGLASRKDKNSRDRIMFAAWSGSGFVLLHVFMKQTQKTPRREIETAKKKYTEYQERGKDNENR